MIPTMAGLAVWLNVDRRTLTNYNDDVNLFPIIARARDRIEENNIQMGLQGCIDNRLNILNITSNFGYSDQPEPPQNPVQININFTTPGADLQRIAELESRLARYESITVDQEPGDRHAELAAETAQPDTTQDSGDGSI